VGRPRPNMPHESWTRREFLARGSAVLTLSGVHVAMGAPVQRARAGEEPAVGQVISRDGTTIAYERSGSGPPLLLVHGATADRTRWAGVAPRLGTSFTVHAMDRRGRGHSGDTAEYSIEREFEDVAAVVDAIAAADGPVNLLGHSFGGICALEGARLTSRLRRLVLYEPAGMALDRPLPPDIVERLEALLVAGQREQLLETFFREVVRMPERELALFRTRPAWSGRVAAAHTLPRELRAIEGYRYDRNRIATVRVPSLVLAGGDSPAEVRRICDLVADALPNARLEVMPGQQHIAMDTAPDLFVDAVTPFLAPR
jgi:pimeloyl-ACP methyl ester carboxylesterase